MLFWKKRKRVFCGQKQPNKRKKKNSKQNKTEIKNIKPKPRSSTAQRLTRLYIDPWEPYNCSRNSRH